ncbi:dihydroxyacetone kinase subunit DhaL [Stigmatella aurantiaca]|uniref:Dihydroxyacetone kinase, L subunit n=1 Tax=Stigmatella aurantiaca (strain DW4/3-1) TaxID=378806 RepID=Q097J6_STIAD|nr:dihydroxyacetone kinase subunit DhaL [Stigmatella aurantiaca]ADO69897.1 Dihydroxyacetone kinase, L subunit [Stigmatella aurantiaca DW4/3-1]EAU67871.1 dihydroxyacetone kinase, L subunit [Stigmatella aurantiaca DW4/3-1]
MPVTRETAEQWIRAYAAAIAEHEQALTQLDMAIGDGDHGANMQRGFQAVLSRLGSVAEGDLGALFKLVGMTLLSTVGGTSGPLYGTLFLQMALKTQGKHELAPEELEAALRAGLEGIIARGKAAPGDKTMIDALKPAQEALRQALNQKSSLAEALRRAEEAARTGRDATIALVARKGRASYLGERSAGHQDPGATSAHLLMECAARTWM